MELSPFTTLLKVQIESSPGERRFAQFRDLLMSVIEESDMLHPDKPMLSLDVLLLSLRRSNKWEPSNALFEFLDNCVLRLARKPVHYYDALSNLVSITCSPVEVKDTHIDLLLIALFEQWQYLVNIADASTITNVAMWLVRYIEMSSLRIRHTGITKFNTGAISILTHIRDQLKITVEDKKCRSMFENSLKDPPELGLSIDSTTVTSFIEDRRYIKEEPRINNGPPELSADLVPPGPPQEHEEHLGLHRWARQDIQGAVIDGVIEELFLCLCSRYAEIRQQAMINVANFMGQLKVKWLMQTRSFWLTVLRHQTAVDGSRFM